MLTVCPRTDRHNAAGGSIPQPHTFVLAAASVQSTEQVQLLCSLSTLHAQVSTALLEAASHGHTRVCSLLLEHGARANASDSWPLRAAALRGHAGVCQVMLEHGAGLLICIHALVVGEMHAGVCQVMLNHGTGE